MTKSSVLAYFARMHGNALSEDWPCEANSALYYANNVQHLFDMSTQLRVNWVAHSLATAAALPDLSTTVTHIASYYFPVSMSIKGGFPEDIVIRIGAATSGGTLSLEAVLLPASSPICAEDRDKHIAKFTGNTASTTGEWVIQDRLSAQSEYTAEKLHYVDDARIDTATFTDPANTTKQKSESHMYRLSIYGWNAVGSNIAYIMGVSVREFHYQ